jgi:hypothetical protein
MMMKFIILASLVMLAGGAATAQQVPDSEIAEMAKMQRDQWPKTDGKPVRIQFQLFERLISIALPHHFLPSYQEQQGGAFIAEFAPDGESTATWTHLVTLRALHGLGRAPVSSEVVADRLFNPRVCINGPLYKNFGERQFQPGIKVTTIALGCAALPVGAYPEAMAGAGEQDFVWLFRDETNFYAVKWSVRGAPWPVGQPPIPLAAAERELAALGPVQLCADAASEEPCKTNLLLERARRGAK